MSTTWSEFHCSCGLSIKVTGRGDTPKTIAEGVMNDHLVTAKPSEFHREGHRSVDAAYAAAVRRRLGKQFDDQPSLPRTPKGRFSG